MKNTHLSKFYYKVKHRRGGKRAIIALSRKIMVIIYHLLKNKDVYNEEKFEISKQKQDELRLKRISLEAKRLGYCVVAME